MTAVGADGFFLQTPDARIDADAQTSNGIWVYTGTAPTVAAGDLVDVTGGIVEFFDFTEISGGVTVTQVGTAAVPAAVTLNPSGACPWPSNELERFEGMRVKVVNGTVAGPTDRFGDASIVATASRPFRGPGIACPGQSGLPVWDGNPEIFEVDPNRLGLPATDLAGGAVLTLVEGGYRVSGRKWMIGNAPLADVFCVLCRAPDRSVGLPRLTMLLVEATTPGVSRMQQHEKTGLHATPTG